MASPAPYLPTRRRRFASIEQEVFLNLWRTYDRLRMLEDELFSQFDLTAQQYNVLRVLRAAGPDPLPTLGIAERLISRAPDITRMLDRLESRSLVQRHRVATNRRVEFHIVERFTPEEGYPVYPAEVLAPWSGETVKITQPKQPEVIVAPPPKTTEETLEELLNPNNFRDDDEEEDEEAPKPEESP